MLEKFIKIKHLKVTLPPPRKPDVTRVLRVFKFWSKGHKLKEIPSPQPLSKGEGLNEETLSLGEREFVREDMSATNSREGEKEILKSVHPTKNCNDSCFRMTRKCAFTMTEQPHPVSLSLQRRGKKLFDFAKGKITTNSGEVKKAAFTLAETLIVIAVMGIIAMLTVPNVIRQHMEAVARTKIKKSMTVYDLAITKMTVENDLRSDKELENWADNAEKNDCANTSAYFKAKGCQFKTSDGVYWDISDILNPIIALNKDDFISAIASRSVNGKTTFKLLTSFDSSSGAFRINDIGYEQLRLQELLSSTNEQDKKDAEEALEELEQLYDFINDKESKDDNSDTANSGGGDNSNNNNSGGSYCASNDILCQYKRGDTIPECVGSVRESCVYKSWGGNQLIGCYEIYDSNGDKVVDYNTSFDSNGNVYKSGEYITNADGSETGTNWAVDSNGNIYKSYEHILNNAAGYGTVTNWAVDSNGNIYKSYEGINNADGSNTVTYWLEDSNGNVYKWDEYIRNADGSYCHTDYNPDGSMSSQDGNSCS